MARPKRLFDTLVIQTRIENDIYQILKDLAQLESTTTGKITTVQDLIRNALDFVYKDGELVRECFRRSRIRGHRKVNFK